MGDNIYNSLGDFYDAHQMETFDYAFGQFKAQLRECVRDEWVSEMARLREENAKYADIKARWAEIEAERQREREELKRDKSAAVNQARRECLEKLLENVCFVVYAVDKSYQLRPKCGKCDDNRLIHYKSPVSGKELSEPCPYCGHSKPVYSVGELWAYEFRHFPEANQLLIWYKKDGSSDMYARLLNAFDDETPFEDISGRAPGYFKIRERCQAYCDWLNKRERNQEGDDE